MDKTDTEVIIIDNKGLESKGIKFLYQSNTEKTQNLIKKISEVDFKKATAHSLTSLITEELKGMKVKTYDAEYSEAALAWTYSDTSRKRAIIVDAVAKEFHISDLLSKELDDETKANIAKIKELIDPERKEREAKERADKASEENKAAQEDKKA